MGETAGTVDRHNDRSEKLSDERQMSRGSARREPAEHKDEHQGGAGKADSGQSGDQGAAADDAGKSKPMSRGRKLLLALVAVLVIGTLATAGTLYWLHARQFESTDDAAIDGYISQVAPQVAGRVTRIAVSDNQRVAAGQSLADIDPRDYQVRLDQALAQQAQSRSQLDQARAMVALQRETIDQSAAQVRVTDADLMQAQQDLARFRAIDAKAITRQQLDNATATSRSAQARLDANRHAVAAARAQLDSQLAQVANAQAALKASDTAVQNAELQLSYTHITAPVAGRVTQRTVNVGNYVNPGQVLVYVVPDGMWVTANFKETQLAHMQPGQAVEVQVDAVPDRTFHGHVDSFQAGSGSAFSTLPAENATGNYVKVVQRVPVKITLDDADDPRLSPGLSVLPRVKVR